MNKISTNSTDLNERRKTDTPQDGAPTDEQNANGAVMDAMTKREEFLVSNKDAILNSDSLMLYRLPLNEEQLANVYHQTCKDYFDNLRSDVAHGHSPSTTGESPGLTRSVSAIIN